MVNAHVAKLNTWRAQGVECEKGGKDGRSRCHNELVLDASAWTTHMPRTIVAVFFQRTSSEKSVANARAFHHQLLQRYGLEAKALPLVVYDDKEKQAPFALASAQVGL